MKKTVSAIVVASAFSFSVNAESNIVAGYFADWQYANTENPYVVADIPADNLTHIIYAFLSMCGPHSGASEAVQQQVAQQCEGKAPYTAIVVDKKAALEEDFGDVSVEVDYQGHFAQLAQLKNEHPNIKILPSFGGWTMSEPFHAMAKDPKAIAHFSKTAVELIAKYDFFDGIDLDWEYPGGGGLTTSPWNPDTKLSDEVKASERTAFTHLVKVLRADLDSLSKQTEREYELSTAVGVGAKTKQIDWQAASPYLTNMFAMTYDFLGGWGTQTGHMTNLHATERSWWGMGADVFINQMIEQGIPSHKLVIGAAFYGRGWQGTQAYNGELPKSDLQSDGGAPFGTGENGYFMYWDLVKNYGDAQGYQYKYDEQAQAPYLWNPESKVFISFEDQRSIKAKAAWAKSKNLGGIFVWELSGDPTGELVEAMSEELK
ncbi:glycoside hydrolase family 18 protein [Aliivibrio finisterrensis]|uniref:glycoside hydrolase family 18 protein n=1 Tax=Aliivibrio finisterrensis TaxID=511998 RepID=UPI00101EFBC5|nr:glycoside hydrolase family 18 protein [Aliivibrio finisterrensis]RYU67543.1 glycoside hydrolase family 18 protein [Aliivibrio finisterrensis]RYU70976.1 glycoside hydrolase family 18 protein [Aliivibrio finisterrensis]RYU74537.1 glycoside hydrolase family 18 protein [Aliivibrio finisterrensis]